MPTDDFEGLLNKAIGLKADSIGSSIIERAIRDRQRASGHAERRSYWDHVRTSQSELQALIEAVVVPETWFFRHDEALTALGSLAKDATGRSGPTSLFRMLSLPCSSGEEPDPMAMALLDAGVPAERFRVDAVDISHRVLAVGKRGVYGKRSFRAKDSGYRDRYFEPTDGGGRIRELVQRQVHFQHGNLLNPTCLPAAGIYDAIFCRNVLIYFDRASQNHAIGVLSRLLAPDGFLFVGPAETALLRDHGLVSAGISKTFAFRKASAAPQPAQRVPEAARQPRRLPLAVVPVHVPPPFERSQPAVDDRATAGAAVRFPLPGALDVGVQLANQGRFAEAAQCCEDHLRDHGPTAQVFHLLGLVHDATGRQDAAVVYYRKALYLDPHHRETLVHLALLMDTQNNKSEAHLLRTRARRLAEEGTA